MAGEGGVLRPTEGDVDVREAEEDAVEGVAKAETDVLAGSGADREGPASGEVMCRDGGCGLAGVI